jgi:hypothetical protein
VIKSNLDLRTSLYTYFQFTYLFSNVLLHIRTPNLIYVLQLMYSNSSQYTYSSAVRISNHGVHDAKYKGRGLWGIGSELNFFFLTFLPSFSCPTDYRDSIYSFIFIMLQQAWAGLTKSGRGMS